MDFIENWKKSISQISYAQSGKHLIIFGQFRRIFVRIPCKSTEWIIAVKTLKPTDENTYATCSCEILLLNSWSMELWVCLFIYGTFGTCELPSQQRSWYGIGAFGITTEFNQFHHAFHNSPDSGSCPIPLWEHIQPLYRLVGCRERDQSCKLLRFFLPWCLCNSFIFLFLTEIEKNFRENISKRVRDTSLTSTARKLHTHTAMRASANAHTSMPLFKANPRVFVPLEANNSSDAIEDRSHLSARVRVFAVEHEELVATYII